MQDDSPISHIERRRAQAPVIVAIIEELSKTLGKEKAMSIISAAIEKDTIRAAEQIDFGHEAGLADLALLVRSLWCEENAQDIDILQDSNEEFHFNVTRCKFAEMYEEMGIKEYGACLSCNRDAAFANGLNSKIKLERNQTIMEGASYCDFRFSIAKSTNSTQK